MRRSWRPSYSNDLGTGFVVCPLKLCSMHRVRHNRLRRALVLCSVVVWPAAYIELIAVRQVMQGTRRGNIPLLQRGCVTARANRSVLPGHPASPGSVECIRTSRGCNYGRIAALLALSPGQPGDRFWRKKIPSSSTHPSDTCAPMPAEVWIRTRLLDAERLLAATLAILVPDSSKPVIAGTPCKSIGDCTFSSSVEAALPGLLEANLITHVDGTLWSRLPSC